MDYHRVGYRQNPIRPMGMGSSPDGLGAYFQTTYTQPIRAARTGQSIVAAYQPIDGLGGCLPCMAAAAGFGADAPAAPAPSASLLSNFWVKAALGVGAVALVWYTVPGFRKLWGPGGALSPNKRRRHRRNAKWSGKHKRSLPDSSFLLVLPGGHARIEGGHKVTIPRSLRKFPYRTASGSIDLPHLRNAIARIPQSNLPASQRTLLQAKARAILAEHGGYKRVRKAAGGVLRQAA